jgi:hypothetical protein
MVTPFVGGLLADRDVSALGIITRDFLKKNNLGDAHWLVYEFGMFLIQCFGSGQAYKALSDLCFEDSFFHKNILVLQILKLQQNDLASTRSNCTAIYPGTSVH